MEDKSLFTSNRPKTISEGLQKFIDSMVEEIVLEGKPFDTQKKYLKKYSENEGLDYDKLEADINTFIAILDSLSKAFSKVQVKLAEEKGKECHISDDMLKKLLSHSSDPKRKEKKKSADPKPPIGRYLLLGVLLLLLVVLIIFFWRSNTPKPSTNPEIQYDTVRIVQNDTVERMVVQFDTVVDLKYDTVRVVQYDTVERVRIQLDTVERIRVQHDTVVVVKYGTEAEQQYRAAAEGGDKVAQFSLACCYAGGTKGLSQNYEEAVKWYRKSADQGYDKAQNNLGHCYEQGHGVPQNYAEAKKWYQKAADQGNSRAKNNLERLKKQEEEQKAAQAKAEAEKKEDDAYKKCTTIAACDSYLKTYPQGRYVEKVKAKKSELEKARYNTEAERQYRTAAEGGDKVAQFNLACCYAGGTKGLSQNYEEAVKWYRKSADQGYDKAQNNLGHCYEQGHGVPQNYAEAKKWYQKAADQGNSRAKNNLERLKKQEEEQKAAQARAEAEKKAPKRIELKIPAPNWNGKVLQGEAKDKFKLKLKETVRRSDIGEAAGSYSCFEKNNLKPEYTWGSKASDGVFYGKKDDNADISVFPDTYKGFSVLRYDFYEGWYAAYYPDSYLGGQCVMIMDTKNNLLYQLDFTAFSKAPYTKPGDEDYVTQAITNVHLVGDILYVQHGHNTYSSSSGGKNAYISAIDLKNNKIIWTTEPLTCSSTFVIVDNTIVCGYGFSKESRYVYLVDLHTGKRRQKVKVEEVPFYVLQEGNQIHVIGRYGADYIFDMINR
jgi:TPR repeat protein